MFYITAKQLDILHGLPASRLIFLFRFADEQRDSSSIKMRNGAHWFPCAIRSIIDLRCSRTSTQREATSPVNKLQSRLNPR